MKKTTTVRPQDLTFTPEQLAKAFLTTKYSILDSYDAAEKADKEAEAR